MVGGSTVERVRRVAVSTLLLALTACSGAPEPSGTAVASQAPPSTPGVPPTTPATASPTGDATASPVMVTGRLCDQLPSGDQPGNPSQLATMTPDEALTWIPVITIFEASVRAAKLDLRASDGVTIFAPTDDAILAVMTQETIDDLILNRQGELRGLLEAHVVASAMSLEELVDARRVNPVGGGFIGVTTGPEGLAVFDGHAPTVCGDYQSRGARIHIIGGVLGPLPSPAPPGDPHSG